MAEQDFLTDIRETEKQAALTLVNAQEAARLKQEKAREEAARILAQGRAEAAAIQLKLMQEAEAKASAIRSESEVTVQGEVDAIRADCETRFDQAARILAERIVNADAHR